MAKAVFGYFTGGGAALSELISLISTELYLSNNVYWELYNNLTIRNTLNSFINVGGVIDNSNALLIAFALWR